MRRPLIVTALLAIAAATAAAPFALSSSGSSNVASQLALARVSTAKYATDLGRAKADGYQVITPMIPNMGIHFMNPNVKTFDVRKPPILVYLRRGATWQLGALEWVFPKMPTSAPLAGA